MAGTIVIGGAVANQIRVTLEIGPKGKKVVAVAPDWPGLERGATTGEAAIERLLSYVPRYGTVTKLTGRYFAQGLALRVEPAFRWRLG